MNEDAHAERCGRLQEPLVRREDGVFHVGLVLNGTVSSGAWTAGALDGLIEALDAWEAAKAAGTAAERGHSVRISIAGGASGGAVCAALLARAARRRFYHIPLSGRIDRLAASRNPFWRIWVEELDLARMLETQDLRKGSRPAAALLSKAALDAALREILRWEGEGEKARAWLADPLRVVVTQTNLRGVPYRLRLRPGSDGTERHTQFIAHADHVAFCVGAGGAARGDEIAVAGLDDDAWQGFAQHTRASGAFPGGFPPVRLSRRREHYGWRGLMLPAGGGQPPRPRLLVPDWTDHDPATGPLPEDYAYDAVDGGALNNSPFRLVHERMAGLGGSFPRGDEAAYAAIIVIDPFVARSTIPLPAAEPALPQVLGGLLGSLVAHGRYSTSELLLAEDDDIESRHLFTAGRRDRTGQDRWGADALASSGLGAFFGFLDRGIRAHDYLLGKRNMLGWLRRHFVIGRANPIVGRSYEGSDAEEVPIIPVMPALAPPSEPLEWPRLPWQWDGLSGPARSRIGSVVDQLLREATQLSPMIGWWVGRTAERQVSLALKAEIRAFRERG